MEDATTTDLVGLDEIKSIRILSEELAVILWRDMILCKSQIQIHNDTPDVDNTGTKKGTVDFAKMFDMIARGILGCIKVIRPFLFRWITLSLT